MKIKVPKYPDAIFKNEIVKLVNGLIQILVDDYQERPDSLVFSGKLGRFLLNMYHDDAWDIGEIEVTWKDGYDQLIIEYTRNITIKKGEGDIPFAPNQGLDGKIIEGIPGSGTMSKIIGSRMSGLNYSVEKTENPKMVIKLEELK